MWDSVTGEQLVELTGHTGRVSGAVFSPDGARILTTGVSDGSARVWDSVTGEQLVALTCHTGRVSCAVFSPDGARILTTDGDGTLRIWDTLSGEQVLWQLEGLPDGELAVWSVPDHKLLGATPDAWRWLGWSDLVDGVLTRLPAETYGDLPGLGDIPARRALLARG